MEGWVLPKATQKHKDFSGNHTWLEHVGRCDLLASAIAHSIIGRLPLTSDRPFHL
jgi:hypothetical protein